MSTDEPSRGELAVKALWASIADRDPHLLRLLSSLVQIIWVTDEHGNVASEPPPAVEHLSWSAFTGMSREAMRGHGWLKAIHPDDAAKVAEEMRQALATGHAVKSEFRVHSVEGDWCWMMARGTAIRDTHDRIFGWVGTCTDITVSKQTEEALRESQQRLMTALEAGEMSTWIWRLTDNTFWWDEAGERLWGLPPGTEVGHGVEELAKFIHEEDRPLVKRAMEETLATGVACAAEFRALRADGQLQWLSSRGRIEYDANGKPDRVVGAFVDITKLKVAEESVRQAQKMQALGTLAGGIAHDFNNLLLAIDGNARLVLADLPAQHPGSRSLHEIVKASERGVDLVRRIMAFAAKRPQASASTALVPAIEETLSLLRSSIPQQIHFETEFSDRSPCCALGAAEVQQIVVNLVNNAVHAIGEAEGTISIAVEADDLGFTRVRVSDTGCGMDDATRGRIFDPFFTTKPPGKGTGLGLAVVHGIVQGCGGRIEVESTVRRGSTFILSLPLTAKDEPAKPVVREPVQSGDGEHILYVDDDEAVVFLIEHWLRRQGYRVSCYTDAQKALDVFSGNPDAFDVVITDLSMPGMNGFDFARGVKAVRPDIPVVMTSGFVREEDERRAEAIGIVRTILKPNTIDELGVTLHELFAQLAPVRRAIQ